MRGPPTAGQPALQRQVMAAVPWSAPWLAPWRTQGLAVTRSLEQGIPVWQALNLHVAAPVEFVPQGALPTGIPYEQFIAETGRCPTRDGLHDLFNGLCWGLFPATKQRLNRLQATQIARDGIQPTRGAVRDALTVFDENAALLHAPDALWDALIRRRWHALFGELRPLWAQARLVLFGHALLEKLVAPRPSITAHVFRVGPTAGSCLADWDPWLAAALDDQVLTSRPWVPLPVLGVPGWWAANSDPDFYADTRVFRPAARADGPGQ